MWENVVFVIDIKNFVDYCDLIVDDNGVYMKYLFLCEIVRVVFWDNGVVESLKIVYLGEFSVDGKIYKVWR